MTIPEMHAWLLIVEPGPKDCAVRNSFELCIKNPVSVIVLENLIYPLNGTEEVAYLLALGHYIALAGLNALLDGKVLDTKHGGLAAPSPLEN